MGLTWSNPNKRQMEKGDVILLVGKNCPRDMYSLRTSNMTSVLSREFEPMHSHISFVEIVHKIISTAILSLPPIFK